MAVRPLLEVFASVHSRNKAFFSNRRYLGNLGRYPSMYHAVRLALTAIHGTMAA